MICCEILLFIFACLKQEDEELKESAFKLNAIIQNEMTQFIIGASSQQRDSLEQSLSLDIAQSQNANELKSQNFEVLFEEINNIIQQSQDQRCVIEAIKWIERLLDHFPEQLLRLSSQIVKNLNHKEEAIVEISVKLIAKYICKQDRGELVGDILKFLESRIGGQSDQSKTLTILRILFLYIEGEKALNFFTETLSRSHNLAFKKIIVRSLDTVLNIEQSLQTVRVKLRINKE